MRNMETEDNFISIFIGKKILEEVHTYINMEVEERNKMLHKCLSSPPVLAITV